jgi:hypothetical protein
MTFGIEPDQLQRLRRQGYAEPDQTHCRDGQESGGVAHGEQRATGERAGDLSRGLHGLEHALRPGLMAWLGRAAHLGEEARQA